TGVDKLLPAGWQLLADWHFTPVNLTAAQSTALPTSQQTKKGGKHSPAPSSQPKRCGVQNTRLQLLLQLTMRITSNLELREVLRSISANVRKVMQADAAGVAFFDEASDRSRIYAVDFDAKGFVKEEIVSCPVIYPPTIRKLSKGSSCASRELEKIARLSKCN